MKKYFAISIFMAFMSLIVLSGSAFAQYGKGMGHGKGTCQGKGNCAKFVDANADGKCDNFVDANADGKCDNCTGTCGVAGQGTCQGKGNCGKFVDANADGKCDNFVDANADGKCDNFVDANADGKCDNCTGACIGKGKGMGQGKGKCDASGKGMGQGKGKCGNTCKTGTASNTNFTLDQNAPNPVTGTTKITFNLDAANNVKVVLSDKIGNKVKDVFEGDLKSGNQVIEMNVDGLAPGNYFYSVYVGGKVQTKQLIVVK